MLVVMQNHATQEQIDRVVKAIEEMGYAARPMPGETRTTVGLVGNDGRVDGSRIEALPGVAEIIHVSKPYKQVSREWRRRRTPSSRSRPACRSADRRSWSSPVRARWNRRSRSSARRGPCATPAPPRCAAARSSRAAHRTRSRDSANAVSSCSRSRAAKPACRSSPKRSTKKARTSSPNTPTASRSARATCRTTPCSAPSGSIGKPVLLKRGMAATITDLLMSAEYILAEGNGQVILCERGIRSFDTMTRNLFDLTAIPIVQRLSHLPMIADPSHGTGLRDKVIPMARAAVAAGADGVLVEVHPNARPRAVRRRPVALPRSVRPARRRAARDHERHRRAQLAPTPRNGRARRRVEPIHANPHAFGSGRALPAIVARRAASRAQSPDATIDRAVAAWAKVKTVRGTFEQTVTNSLTGTSANVARRLRRRSVRIAWRFDSRSPAPTPSSPTAKSCGSICRAARRARSSSARRRIARGSDRSDRTVSRLAAHEVRHHRRRERGRSADMRRTGSCSCQRRERAAPFTKATVWVDDDDSLIREFEVDEANGVTRHMRLTSVEPNAPVERSRRSPSRAEGREGRRSDDVPSPEVIRSEATGSATVAICTGQIPRFARMTIW